MKNSIMKKIMIFMSMMGMSCTIAFAEEDLSYPLLSLYPEGITAADESLFTDSKIAKSIETGFEEKDEIEAVDSSEYSGSISVVEEAKSGKFALKLSQMDDSILPIKESESFAVTSAEASVSQFALYTTGTTASSNAVNVSSDDKRIYISGISGLDSDISVLLYDANGNIAYVEQLTPDSDGYFEFDFSVKEYGTYELMIGGVSEETYTTQITLASGKTTNTEVVLPGITEPNTEGVDVITNIVSVWIKPMYGAKDISFYTKNSDSGEYMLLLSDYDSDGVYTIGEDLSQGKWQKVDINLLTAEGGAFEVNGLYAKANTGSEWIFDDITSFKRDEKEVFADLERFNTSDIVYTTEELKFASTANRAIAVGDVDVTDRISGIKIDKYVDIVTNNADSLVFNKIDGFSSAKCISTDGNLIYYKNTNDSKIYSYNISTGEIINLLDVAVGDYYAISPDGTKIAAYLDTDIIIYDLEYRTSEIVDISDTSTLEQIVFGDVEGEQLFITMHPYDVKYDTVYLYKNGQLKTFYTEDKYYINKIYMSANKQMMAIERHYSTSYESTVYIFKKTGAEWINTNVSIFLGMNGKVYFSADNKKVYYCNADGWYEYNMDTKTKKADVSLIGVADTGELIRHADEATYLYNPVTGESLKILDSKSYIPTVRNGYIIVISSTGVCRFKLEDDVSDDKYLLSFDGKAHWYSYSGGRWILASSKSAPTYEEIENYGMTAKDVNEIPASAFSGMYQNDTDILNVNIAVYMKSTSDNVKPAIREIKVKTINDKLTNGIYGSGIKKFNKADYSKINGLFPIENFDNQAENYYLLYLGNDWIYTYKNGRMVQLAGSANELFADVSETWKELKQYGMTAKELRNIPTDDLTKLFLNESFANEEFGIINVLKTDDTSTENYSVEYKLQAEKNYFDNEGMVIEIILGGTDKKVIYSSDLSDNALEDFMNWLSARKNGSENVFYHLNSNKGQYFVNYYMITSVNVYTEEEYNQLNAQSQEIKTTSINDTFEEE